MLSRFLRIAAALAAIAVITSCSVRAPVPDDWRARGSVSAVVAFAPGGGSDRSARVLAQGLNELEHGYDVNVENKEGGSGAVGWATFLAEEGNGNALLVAETALNTLPLVYEDVPFTYRSFTPLVMFAQDSRMVVAPADSPFETCADVVRASATQRVVSGSSGRTGADALVVAELTGAGGAVDVVPYGSTGEVMTGLLGGQIDLAPASAASAKPYLESGDAKALCTMTEQRYDDPVLGSVPTAREQGIDALVTIWRGALAPAGIAESQRRFWIDELHRAMRSPAYLDYIRNDLLIPADLSGDEFGRFLDDYDRQMREVF
ncbi:tripartite tricarboxylate transporter substrate binding protein [Saccharopolyspora sp. NFXS83]|uniref:tripartite tricarboxylate transporter substrate binding protein n=1 Tax=Saccharopolyspora sp. NFXS83 TaxID=2993560 RepID=UPI00224B50B4|nr:tripartite tricarboxylate transporter substrate binding protein [Saccharopolyspora sp. NFXS83]MCX2730727.1 tripartite tricarboxylate transporter substrate binding protein [Saccharopolyspora sp. NFXS83]